MNPRISLSDVGDAALRERLLRQVLPDALAGLREDARPAWGNMTAQQMVEHLAWVFEVSIGEAGVYRSKLPDFMVFLNWKQLPWFWLECRLM